MRPHRLNLSALRARVLPRSGPGGPKEYLANSADSPPLSRRQVLGLTSAAFSLSPVTRGIEEILLGPVTVTATRTRVAFTLAGRERWVIDATWFSGAPLLGWKRSAKSIHVELRNAFYPGTNLPADFECDLERVVGGWTMNLRLALGGLTSRQPFERWLLGLEPARGSVEVNRTVSELGSRQKLSLAERGQAEFRANWTMRIKGHRVARLHTSSSGILSDRVEIALLDREAPSLTENPAVKRTLVTLDRGRRSWQSLPLPARGELGGIVTAGNAFDSLAIEIGETRRGARRAALVAEAKGNVPGLFYQPSRDLLDQDGHLFRLPLRDALYAAVFDRTGENTALLGRFPQDPVWMFADGCAMQIGDCADGHGFEQVTSNGRVEAFRCAPALFQLSAPMDGAIVAPVRVPANFRVEFALAGLAQQRVQAPQVRIDTKRIGSLVSLPGLSVSVLRPQDLLSITFQFTNLKLEAQAGQSRLVRTQPDQPAYIRVDFPPQNIAEQAFFEVDENYDIPPNPKTGKADQDASRSKSEDLAEPPVDSRLSGPSWLVFDIPDEVKEIPYTLEDLLKACSEFPLSLPPTALPPSLRNLPSGTFRSCEEDTRFRRPAKLPTQTSSDARKLDVGIARQAESVVAQKIMPKAADESQPKSSTATLQTQPGAKAQLADAAERISLARLVKIAPPADTETAIECPYRLFVSPNRFGGWVHALQPVQGEQSKRTELWHTRLGVRCKDKEGKLRVDEFKFPELRTLRAVWSPDYPINTRLDENKPFRMSLTGQDRYQIVEITSNYALKKDDGSHYDPDPVDVERLMLTALGAWMDTRGAWEPPGKDLSLEEWRHLATMGRDQFVRVVYRGYLFPFGHRASLIKITERKFHPTPKSRRMAAYLRQRMFIVVREPEKDYPAFGQPHGGRKSPFLRLRTTTLVTPNLDPPAPLVKGLFASEKVKLESTDAFWPRVDGSEFPFNFVAEDWEGNRSEFTAPVIFVSKLTAFADPPSMPLQKVFETYHVSANLAHRTREFRGQKVAYADNTKPGDTTFETDRVIFEAEPGFSLGKADVLSSTSTRDALLAQGQPPFYPAIKEAAVRVAAVEQLTGTDSSTSIGFHTDYLDSGFGSANKGQVFAELLDTVQLQFGGGSANTDKAGGFLTPNLAISGLSRSLGPVGGELKNLVAGQFDPKEFFKGTLQDAKILGGISLWDILQVVNDFTGLLDRVPKFITSRLPDAIETSFGWKAHVKNGPDPSKPILTFASPQDALSVQAKLRAPLIGAPPSYEINASLKKFDIHLVPSILEVIVLKFNSLSFIAKSGSKPDVSVDFDNYQFAGPLKFVDSLRQYIPLDGFKDPPNLDITAEGVKLGYSLGLPPITVGVMSIQNIALAAEFRLPFTGAPLNFRFAFSERHNPFLLTVTIFAGGGFFGLELEPTGQGLKKVEGSFEFGGNFALNLGVASGGVHLMAGIYFAVTGQKTDLSGYVRCGGSLEVLGLICISAEFYLILSYKTPPARASGRATLTIEIEIAFWSVSVDLTVEREFAGSGSETAWLPVAGDYAPALPITSALSVDDLFTAEDWKRYCDAFA